MCSCSTSTGHRLFISLPGITEMDMGVAEAGSNRQPCAVNGHRTVLFPGRHTVPARTFAAAEEHVYSFTGIPYRKVGQAQVRVRREYTALRRLPAHTHNSAFSSQ